ncbi:MAG: hypothetical protein ACI841_000762, partial [Planctomycetota bacterium]
MADGGPLKPGTDRDDQRYGGASVPPVNMRSSNPPRPAKISRLRAPHMAGSSQMALFLLGIASLTSGICPRPEVSSSPGGPAPALARAYQTAASAVSRAQPRRSQVAKPELSPAGIRHGKPLRVSRVRELSAAARPDAVRAQSLAAQNSLRSAPSLSRAIDLTLESSRSRVECFLLERLTAHAEIEVEGMLTLSRTDRDVGVQLQSDTEFHDGLRVLNVEKRQATSHRMTWRELGGGDTRTWLLEGAIDKGDWIDIRTMLWGTKFSQHQAPHGGTPRISPCFLLEQLRNNRLPESMTLATDGSARIHVADGLRHRFEALTVMSSPPMHS